MTTFFITGATGVVGNALAEQLLRETDAELRILVRAHSDSELQGRAAQLLDFWGIDRSAIGARMQAIRGDTTLPRLGMSTQVFEQLARECTHLVHCAAAVRMNLPLQEARLSAVTAAHNVIALADACRRNGVLKKLEFVSTVGVGGRLPGPLPERWITGTRAFHNTYEQAKAEAEEIVASHIASGLPATVHRPSMVVGDARSGKIIRFQVFYHLAEFLSGIRTHGIFPDLGETKLDLVPVDYVARSILWSSGRAETVGRILHLCAGPVTTLPVAVLRDRIRQRFRRAGIALPAARTVPVALFRAALPFASIIAPPHHRRALAALPIFLDYLAEQQVFDDEKTTQLLIPAGIPFPPLDEALESALDYYLARRSRSGSPKTPA